MTTESSSEPKPQTPELSSPKGDIESKHPVDVLEQQIVEINKLVAENEALVASATDLAIEVKKLQLEIGKLNRSKIPVTGNKKVGSLQQRLDAVLEKIKALGGEITETKTEVGAKKQPDADAEKKQKKEAQVVKNCVVFLKSSAQPIFKKTLLQILIQGKTEGFTISPVFKAEADQINELGDISDNHKTDAQAALDLLEIFLDQKKSLKEKKPLLKKSLEENAAKNNSQWPLFHTVAQQYEPYLDKSAPATESAPTPATTNSQAKVEIKTESNPEITHDEFLAEFCDTFFQNLEYRVVSGRQYEVKNAADQWVSVHRYDWRRVVSKSNFDQFARAKRLDPGQIFISNRDISNYIDLQLRTRRNEPKVSNVPRAAEAAGVAVNTPVETPVAASTPAAEPQISDSQTATNVEANSQESNTFELFDGTKIDTALAGHHVAIHKDVVRLQNKRDPKKTRSVENFSITYQPQWITESDFSSKIVVSGTERKVKLRLPISSPQEIEFSYKQTSEIQGLVEKFKNLITEFDTKNQAAGATPEAPSAVTSPEVVPESVIDHNTTAEGSAVMASVSLDAGAENLVTSTHTVSSVAEAPPTPPASSEHHESSEHRDVHDHHTPPPEIPSHTEHHESHSSDRLIIDIPEHELARLFPTNALRDFAADLADPNKRDQALVYFKNFFTYSTDKAGLAAQVKKFGYQTLDEFLVHWKTELHQKPLAAFEQWVAQLETNIINEKISWSESLSHGVIWEKTKKVARQSARLLPVALAATAGSAATIALTGGAAIAAAGTAGAISGFFGRFFKKSESFKKTDEEIKARITEKENAIKKERQESAETRDKITAQLKALDTHQFTAFLSQSLRETSADALHVGEPVNAALLRAHALRVIERGMSERSRAGELAPNQTEDAIKDELNGLLATLHANSQADKAKIQQLVDKNPVMQKALAKFLELKSGGSTETSSDKFDWGYVGAAAAGAGLSIATTMNSLWRMVPGGIAGGYLGMLYGNEKDKEAQSKAFTEDAAKCLQVLERKLGERGGPTFTQKHEKDEIFLSTSINNNEADVSVSETKIRTALQLGFLDNRIDLKMRANNILRRIDALKLEQEGSHVAQLDNLMKQLQANTDSLQAKKKSMIDSLGKRSHLKATLYAIAGAAAGAFVGWKGGEWMRNLYHSATADSAADGAVDAGHTTGVDHAQSGGAAVDTESALPRRAPEIPELALTSRFSVTEFTDQQQLDPATKEYLVRLTTKFPDLNNQESLERLLAAGQRGSLPEFGTRASGVFLQEAAEADLVKFEEILKHGGPTQAAAYLEARGFNSLDHRLLGTKDYAQFAAAYQTKVLDNPNPDTHVRTQLAKAFQHDEMRDSHDWASSKTGKTMYGDGARTSLGRDAIILGTDETVPNGGVIADKAKEFLYNKSLKPESLKLDPDQMRRLNDARAYDLVEKVKQGEVDLKTLKSELPVENESAGQPTINSLEMSADPGYVDVILDNGQAMKAAVHINAAGEPVLVSTNKYQLENRAQLPVQKFGTPVNNETQRVASGGADKTAVVPEVVRAEPVGDVVTRLITDHEMTKALLPYRVPYGNNPAQFDVDVKSFATDYVNSRASLKLDFNDPKVKTEFLEAFKNSKVYPRVLSGESASVNPSSEQNNPTAAKSGDRIVSEKTTAQKMSTDKAVSRSATESTPVKVRAPKITAPEVATPAMAEPLVEPVGSVSAEVPVQVVPGENGKAIVYVWNPDQPDTPAELSIAKELKPEVVNGQLKLTDPTDPSTSIIGSVKKVLVAPNKTGWVVEQKLSQVTGPDGQKVGTEQMRWLAADLKKGKFTAVE